MKSSRFRVLGVLLAVLAAVVTLGSLTACDPSKTDPALQPDANGQTTLGTALISTGSPWGLLAGTAVNVIASVFIAKSTSKTAVEKNDREEYNPDDIAAMIRGMEAAGYVVQRKADLMIGRSAVGEIKTG